jgi:hypothetical protein
MRSKELPCGVSLFYLVLRQNRGHSRVDFLEKRGGENHLAYGFYFVSKLSKTGAYLKAINSHEMALLEPSSVLLFGIFCALKQSKNEVLSHF